MTNMFDKYIKDHVEEYEKERRLFHTNRLKEKVMKYKGDLFDFEEKFFNQKQREDILNILNEDAKKWMLRYKNDLCQNTEEIINDLADMHTIIDVSLYKVFGPENVYICCKCGRMIKSDSIEELLIKSNGDYDENICHICRWKDNNKLSKRRLVEIKRQNPDAYRIEIGSRIYSDLEIKEIEDLYNKKI